jgi:3-deoxy-7-phosphoheptulonate synthase
MLIVMKHGATQEQINAVENFIKEKGFDAHISQGELHTIIGAVGGKIIDERDIQLLEGVREIIRISTSYKLASRAFQNEDTVISIKDVTIGANEISIICRDLAPFESYEQMDETAAALKKRV